MRDLENRFEQELLLRAEKVRESRPKIEVPARSRPKVHFHKHCHSDKKHSHSGNV
jgi:hypothetical protein